MCQLVECVPNFSEGSDKNAIEAIASVIREISGVKLLHIDIGYDANRTVITFVGTPEAVAEAAFLSIKKASEVIDMSRHKGEHPRIGAADVCPLVPVAGITMEEVVLLSRQLGKRVADELNIPVYIYGEAAFSPERASLADIRKGEYEGLQEKMQKAGWKPDFGSTFNPRTGATVIGARKFLIAFNVNLNTRSDKIAKRIAGRIRESGYFLGSEKKERVPGTLKAVRAIGWYMESYGKAQVSTNLTDTSVTPVHVTFDEISKVAIEEGTKVTGSELIGLIPLNDMLNAGRYFMAKKGMAVVEDEKELVQSAIEGLGLDELQPFLPEKKILEYAMLHF